MNWKDLKNSNTLVSIFVDDVKEYKIALEETLYSISKQTVQPDLLVLTKGLNDEDKKALEELLKAPKIIVRRRQVDEKTGEEKAVEEELVTDGKINYILVDSEAESFPQVFNQILTGF